ncbi:MAG: hypothetical protein JWN52_3385 [Actinomycetia bacterium]|nr:hypothetical protein [Actinomycetes bacterium]
MSASDEPPEDLVFDEAFVAAASVKEPSAKERKGNLFTRRLAERRRRKAMIKQWRAPQVRRSRRPGARTITVLLVVGLVALAAVLAQTDPLDLRPGHSPDTIPVTLTPVPDLSTAPSDHLPQSGDPFTGSPAVSYANGAAGITFPAAKATAGFSKKDVQLLFSKTRALLMASHLNPKTLFNGGTDAFAGQLDPDQGKVFTRGLQSRDPEKNLRSWLMSFAPKSSELTGSVIKVHGETTLSEATRQGRRGALAKVNYIFVYPVHRPGRPDTSVRVIAHLRGEVFHSRDERGEWTWIYRWGSSNANARCDVEDHYVHPFYEDSQPDLTARTGAPVDPYDLNEDPGTDCQTVSRT